jgi:acyl-CoA synthetase (AMP-forming)/AMP-acid ligase II
LTVTSGVRCLPDMARVWSGKTPDKAALIDGGRVVTYAQLNDRSNRIANTLIAAGIRPGSHIGFLGKNSASIAAEPGRQPLPCDRAAAKDMTELFPLTGPRKLVHGERESFIGGYGWQRSGPSVGSPGPDVGGGCT